MQFGRWLQEQERIKNAKYFNKWKQRVQSLLFMRLYFQYRWSNLFALFVAIVSDWSNVVANGQGAVWLFPIVFGFLGAITLVIGILLICWYHNDKKRIQRLLDRGEYVIADIIGFPVNYRNRINGIPTYLVECTYKDPVNGTVHVFKSKDIGIAFTPERITAKTVKVYVDYSSGFQDYYVDVDSILPNIVRH